MASEFPGEKSRVRSVASGCPASLINTVFQFNYCTTWHYQVWHGLSVSNISLTVLLKFNMSSWNTSYLRF